jgi:hypothetical protein
LRSSFISVVGVLATLVLVGVTEQASADAVLWNKLGSNTEVLNSAYGPNLSFFNSPGGIDLVGNPSYVPGVFGNGITIGPGSYATPYREHTIVWSGVDQYLNPNRGTIEAWYKQNQDPVPFDHGVYRIFDGSYGLGSGIGFTSEFPSGPTPMLYFGMDFGGTPSFVSYNISPLNGTWIHVAGVWDRNGIANSNDKIRLYINGIVVASNVVAGWGNTVGMLADIAGGNDANIDGKFAMDNLKVYNTAVTDFSNRFDEAALPEPGFALIGSIGLLLLRHRKRS